MRSAVYYGKKDVRLMDSPEPMISEFNNVKIKVRCCGICGSDLEEYYYGPVVAPVEEHPLTHQKIPFTLGHELSGEVVEVGPNVKNIKVGDLVVCHPVISCGECYWCKKGVMCLCEQMACLGLQRDGGFADYIVVPETNCFRIPEGTDMGVIMVDKHLVTDQIVLMIGYDVENLADPERAKAYQGEVALDYYGRLTPKHAHGSINLDRKTASS